MNIQHYVNEYGKNNIRIWLYDDQPFEGFFRNPRFGFCEYIVDDISRNHKITIRCCRLLQFDEICNLGYVPTDFYISDFNRLCDRIPDKFKVYVLVDEDDKYQRLF